ncbi:Uncharacterized protein TCM_036708 [Theobroma cacao]|uniref:Uncharacterized protein n=1 Tax=Theobroma cacao TaxID=3641 RepID=A0A061FKQ9_THECC|nr:Uncharacterized protein TCM_036708 [Theobroma cacao]
MGDEPITLPISRLPQFFLYHMHGPIILHIFTILQSVVISISFSLFLVFSLSFLYYQTLFHSPSIMILFQNIANISYFIMLFIKYHSNFMTNAMQCTYISSLGRMEIMTMLGAERLFFINKNGSFYNQA